MISDPSFRMVTRAGNLPGKVQLSDDWTLVFKARDAATRGRFQAEPPGGIEISWEGVPKLVRLWQDLSLSAAGAATELDFEVKIRLEADPGDGRFVQWVAIVKETETGEVFQKLRLKARDQSEDGVRTLTARGSGIRVGQQKCRLCIHFDDNPKRLLLKSVHGKVRRHGASDAKRPVRDRSVSAEEIPESEPIQEPAQSRADPAGESRLRLLKRLLRRRQAKSDEQAEQAEQASPASSTELPAEHSPGALESVSDPRHSMPLFTGRSRQAEMARTLNEQIKSSGRGANLIDYCLVSLDAMVKCECYERAEGIAEFLLPLIDRAEPADRRRYLESVGALMRALGEADRLEPLVLKNLDLPGSKYALWEMMFSGDVKDQSFAELAQGPPGDAMVPVEIILESVRREPSNILRWLDYVHSRLRKHPQAVGLIANFCRELPLPKNDRNALFVNYLNRVLSFYATERIARAAFEPDSVWLDSVAFDTRDIADHAPLIEGGKVSVLMAAFNAAATIGYSVRSILNQTYSDIELLVCDDQSTDDTPKVLAELARDPRVRVFRSTRRQGPYNVRNLLMREAKGAFITFQDADDLSIPTRLARQVAALIEEDRAFVTTRWIRTSADGRIVFFRDNNCLRPCVVSILGRRDMFEAVGDYHSALCGADSDFLEKARLTHGDSVAELKTVGVLGLWESGSLTRTQGLEASADGYRSPARRAYAEAAFTNRLYGEAVYPVEKVESVLASNHIWRKPASLRPLP